MKKYWLLLSSVLLFLYGCESNDEEPIPIAPLLKYIEMPTESNAYPGTDVTIKGRGFDTTDSLFCKSLSNEKDFSPTIVSVTDYDITISVPSFAAGYYQVSDTRMGKTTILPERLYIPYVIVLNNINIPDSANQGEIITLSADGIEAGDEVFLESDNYPSGVSVAVGYADDGKITFTVPSTCYGVNTIKVTRGQKVGYLGTLNICVSLFAQTAGGIVFYISDNGLHGLVVYPGTVGDAAMNWGPSIPNSYAAETKFDIYAGKTNSDALLKQVNDSKEAYQYSHLTPVELCDNLTYSVDNIEYNDWFLPSLNELVELFKVKSQVAAAGFSVPANNYWSSTEADYSGGWVWAMCYCNFYEATNIVTGYADRVNWSIGTLAVRQF